MCLRLPALSFGTAQLFFSGTIPTERTRERVFGTGMDVGLLTRFGASDFETWMCAREDGGDLGVLGNPLREGVVGKTFSFTVKTQNSSNVIASYLVPRPTPTLMRFSNDDFAYESILRCGSVRFPGIVHFFNNKPQVDSHRSFR